MKRVLVKLSGEALAGEKHRGLDFEVIGGVCKVVKKCVEAGVQIGIVVGGGNTALEDALYLADLARKVYLIHRRDSFRGEETSATRLKERDNVEFVWNSNVTRLISEKRLKAIEVTNKLDGSVRVIELNGLFVAVGRVPENQNFANLVQLDEAGYVLAGEDCHTSADGIFVAGDNRTKALRQLVTATADGAMAATEAIKYVNAL